MSNIKLLVSDITESIGITQKILTSRPQGKLAQAEILNRCNEIVSGESLELDFFGIYLCDVSFVDEIIINVQKVLMQKNCTLFVTNIAPGIRENLEAVLALRETKGERIQILELKHKTFSYFGSLEPNLQEAFNIVKQRDSLTARELAEILEIAINNASNRLKKLHNSGLVLRKEQIDSIGKQHIYYLPKT